jgi:hypothetical protein
MVQTWLLRPKLDQTKPADVVSTETALCRTANFQPKSRCKTSETRSESYSLRDNCSVVVKSINFCQFSMQTRGRILDVEHKFKFVEKILSEIANCREIEFHRKPIVRKLEVILMDYARSCDAGDAHRLTRMRHICSTSATHTGTICSRDFGAPVLLTESYFPKLYFIIIMLKPSSKNSIYN